MNEPSRSRIIKILIFKLVTYTYIYSILLNVTLKSRFLLLMITKLSVYKKAKSEISINLRHIHNRYTFIIPYECPLRTTSCTFFAEYILHPSSNLINIPSTFSITIVRPVAE